MIRSTMCDIFCTFSIRLRISLMFTICNILLIRLSKHSKHAKNVKNVIEIALKIDFEKLDANR